MHQGVCLPPLPNSGTKQSQTTAHSRALCAGSVFWMQKIHVFVNGDSDRYALREMGERQLDFGYILQVGWLAGEKEGIKEGRQVKA